MANISVFESARNALRVLQESGNPDAWYLETRGWFMRSPERHQRVIAICNACYGTELDCASGDFDEELTRVEQIYQ